MPKATPRDRFTVRLSASDHAALATIAKAISSPHRQPATTSEALRAALSLAMTALANGAPAGAPAGATPGA